ncbi:hypothetical protein HanPI659440_Chr15g0611251 [Helianthus annuus]|nr:hypothetical protein HanPI659440_Chr15g0611251 [Helianthus annuus]
MAKFLKESRIAKAFTDRMKVYESHVRMFWKSVRYEESEKMIYSVVQKKDENDQDIDVEVKFNVGDVRRVLNLQDSDGDPIIVLERLCKGLWFRMGFSTHVNDKYLKSKFCRPYKFLVHCVIHALSHRKRAYDEPSDYIMNIITCLVLNRPYNISRVIFDHMVDNIKGQKYIMYPRFIQMLIDDQVKGLPKDQADELDLNHMKSETLSRLNQYKGLKKDEPEPRVKRMIGKIENPNYVAPENDAWRHENNNSEDETDSLSGMHEKKLRYWFVKDGKRKRTPKVSPSVTAPKKPTPKIVVKDKVERGNDEAEAAKAAKVQGSSVEKVVESSAKNVDAESVKEKEPEGVAHTDSSATESDTEPKIDTSKIGVGKITLKVKPRKKKKDSDEEDSTYIPTPEERKKLKKHKARPTGVIPRNVRARKGIATMPEMLSGKAPEVQAQVIPEVEVQSVKSPEVQTTEGPEAEKKKAHESPILEKVDKNVDKADDDDDEVVFTGERVSTPPPQPENPTIHILDDPEQSQPKKVTSPGSFEGFPNVQGEFTEDILPDEDYDMLHDGKIKDLSKKVSVLEKEKPKAEAEHDDLKKKLEKSLEMNEEMKLVVNDHAERIDALIEDMADNAKLIHRLTTELAEVKAEYENMRETNKTLHQMLDDLHEASSNENKVLKLEIEALRADKVIKDEQLNMLYTVMEHQLGINVQAVYNEL